MGVRVKRRDPEHEKNCARCTGGDPKYCMCYLPCPHPQCSAIPGGPAACPNGTPGPADLARMFAPRGDPREHGAAHRQR